jgi:hypothetical protein
MAANRNARLSELFCSIQERASVSRIVLFPIHNFRNSRGPA